MKNLREKNPPIRVSTGWGFHNDFPFLQHQILANITDGVELSLTETDRFDFYIENNLKAPSVTIHLSSPVPDQHQEKINKIDSKYDVKGYVLHPRRNIDSIKKSIRQNNLEKTAMIENLDGETETKPSETQLIRCLEFLDSHRLTIDIQHLTEQYDINRAKNFIDTQKDNIVQFHVSGRTDETKHELLINDPDNRDVIESILSYISQNDDLQSVPLVIEGKYTSVGEVKEEYEYIKSIYKD